MKKKFALFVAAAMTLGSLGAAQLPAIREYDRNDGIEPIRPLRASEFRNLAPAQGITAAAVPEPSTLSLLAGSAIIGSWFCLRRRRRS